MSHPTPLIPPFTPIMRGPVTGGNPLIDVLRKLADHIANNANPHRVTASQVGAYTRAEVNRLFDTFTPKFTPEQQVVFNSGITSGKVSGYDGHLADEASNPHKVTAAQVGAYTTADVDRLLTGKQPVGSYATLVSGKIPPSQLPSYVDDVLEYTTKGLFPNPGESGKIYVALDTDKAYRWGGTEYHEISSEAEFQTWKNANVNPSGTIKSSQLDKTFAEPSQLPCSDDDAQNIQHYAGTYASGEFLGEHMVGDLIKYGGRWYKCTQATTGYYFSNDDWEAAAVSNTFERFVNILVSGLAVPSHALPEGFKKAADARETGLEFVKRISKQDIIDYINYLGEATDDAPITIHNAGDVIIARGVYKGGPNPDDPDWWVIKGLWRAGYKAVGKTVSACYDDASDRPEFKFIGRLTTLDGSGSGDYMITDDTTNLQLLVMFADKFAPKSHEHTKSQITDFPTEMKPTAHSHAQSDVTGLPAKLESMDDDIAKIKASARPNVTVVGEPIFSGGSVSNFSASNYLVFPSTVDIGNATVDFDIAFQTGNQVTNQENILDSDFGLALAVRGGTFVLAASTNGTSFEKEVTGGTVTKNSPYRLRIHFDHEGGTHNIKLQQTNGTGRYTDLVTMTLSAHISAKPLYFGGANPISGVNHIFTGSINLGSCALTYNGKEVWNGWYTVVPKHKHELSDINADVFPPESHSHTQSEVTGLEEALEKTLKPNEDDEIEAKSYTLRVGRIALYNGGFADFYFDESGEEQLIIANDYGENIKFPILKGGGTLALVEELADKLTDDDLKTLCTTCGIPLKKIDEKTKRERDKTRAELLIDLFGESNGQLAKTIEDKIKSRPYLEQGEEGGIYVVIPE